MQEEEANNSLGSLNELEIDELMEQAQDDCIEQPDERQRVEAGRNLLIYQRDVSR